MHQRICLRLSNNNKTNNAARQQARMLRPTYNCRFLKGGRTMRCVEISKPGGPEVSLRPSARAGAESGRNPGQGAAAGVNRPDVLQRQGNYPVPPDASDLPGLEIAGEVVAAAGRRG